MRIVILEIKTRYKIVKTLIFRSLSREQRTKLNKILVRERKRNEILAFNDFLSGVLISHMTLLMISFAIKLFTRLNIFSMAKIYTFKRKKNYNHQVILIDILFGKIKNELKFLCKLK